jgi:ketosteroid isomerase-like protein
MNVEARVAQLMGPCIEALNAADLDTFATFWTRDAILWSALGPALAGIDAIRAWAAGLGTKNAFMQPTRCESFVDLIFVVGNFALRTAASWAANLPRRLYSVAPRSWGPYA